MRKTEKLPAIVRNLYSLVESLEGLFPGRHFTPDGHLVGSIGEVLAAHHYGLELLPASAQTHDATAPDGRLVQFKATQVKSIGIREQPKHLLVMKINRNGSFIEIYNGPGDIAWVACGKMQKNGQRGISTKKLAELMNEVPEKERLPRVANAK